MTSYLLSIPDVHTLISYEGLSYDEGIAKAKKVQKLLSIIEKVSLDKLETASARPPGVPEGYFYHAEHNYKTIKLVLNIDAPRFKFTGVTGWVFYVAENWDELNGA